MCCDKLRYIFRSSLHRVISKPKLFLIIVLSLTITMLIPFLCTAVVEAMVEQSTATREKYSEYAYVYRVQTKRMEQQTITQIEDNLCPTAVMVNLYYDYVITDAADEDNHIGRFMDIHGMTADSVTLLHLEMDSSVADAFASGENVCIIDHQTAKACGVRIGDFVSVHGVSYEIVSISKTQNTNIVSIPYEKLSASLPYQHTIYLLFDSPVEEKEIRNAMRSYLPEGSMADLVPLADSYETKDENADNALTTAILVSALYMLYAVVHISVIRYGDMKIHQGEYAITLAVGGKPSDVLLGIWFESLLLVPVVLVLNVGIFHCITAIVPLPLYLSISLVTILWNLLYAILCTILVACIVTKKMLAQPCAVLLKEG